MHTKSSSHLDLNPEVFTKYFILKESLKEHFPNRAVTILEVGEKESPLSGMIKEDKLLYKLTKIESCFFVGFKNNQFDVVVSIDSLVHIPDEKMEDFLKECVRVSKNLVVITAPFKSGKTEKAEHLINGYFKKFAATDNFAIKDHVEMRRPNKDLIEKYIKKNEFTSVSFGINELENWSLMTLCHSLGVRFEQGQNDLKALNRYYNMNFFQLENIEASFYRYFYLISKNKNIKFNSKSDILNYDFNLYKNLYWQNLMLKFFVKYNFWRIDSKSQIFPSFKRLLSDADETERLFKDSKILHEQCRKIEKILEENEKLKYEVAQTLPHINNLQNIVNNIESSKFFKFWQIYCKIRRVILLICS